MRLMPAFVMILLSLATRLTAAEAGLGLSVGSRGELLLAGKPYRGIGVNYYDLFARTLQEPPNTNYEAGLSDLAERRIPFVRFSAGGYWPSDWGLYQTNRAEHFARLDRVVRSAERHGIGLIPSLFWLSSTVPDLVGEPSSRWGDVHSRTYAFMLQYAREVVTRYAGSKAIWGWEFGNEYNLPADLPNAADHRPPVVPTLGTPASRSKEDDLSHAMIRAAFAGFAEEVRRHDEQRIIVSGNAFPRVSAWHQAKELSWKKDTAEQFAEVLAADNPSPMDTLSVRGYDVASDFSRMGLAMAVARSQKKPLFVGEFGVPGETTAKARETFQAMLISLRTNQVPLAALWVYDFDSQSKDWNVTPGNGRGWQLEEIQKANAVAVDPAQQVREYRDSAMGRDGNPERGRAVFNNEQGAACIKCHSIDGSASKAGPDLYAVGEKFPRRELIRSVLEPSAAIAVGYGTTVVETKSGEVIQGILKGSNAEMVDLLGADGKHMRIPTDTIQEQRGSVISLMPEGLQSGMTRQEFVDLIEYLVTLKQPESALTSNRGMPSSIPELARPVTLQPFLTEPVLPSTGVVPRQGDVRFALAWFGQVPGATNRFIAVHQSGKIWHVEKTGTNEARTLFADVSGQVFNERGPNGLLGMAFHPGFRENRRYFLKHQVFEEGHIVTTVVERKASTDLRRDSGEPSRRLWSVVSSTQDHSGGCISFGPDGFLYIGMGDTGPQQDPQGHGQDLGTHLGKILRIDVDRVDAGLGYAIPSDNPFRDRPGVRPEIWAYGFREPWRFSFDRATGELWVGDVGQDRVEEVSIVRRGENQGWNVYEGFEPFSNRYRKDDGKYTAPVFAYRRRFGNSITGGYVYRGNPRASFHGVYVCGDYTSRRLFGIRVKDRALQVVRQIGTSPQWIASFSEDQQGNLYVVGHEGMVYRLDLDAANFDEEAPSAVSAQR